VDRAYIAELGSCTLGRKVTLRHSHHFISNHEFLHGRRTQQRRVIVGMEMPFLVRDILSVGLWWKPME
jgi:hypothetical protein